MPIQSFIAALAFLSLLSPAVSGHSPTDVRAWCSQTPHPEPCEYFLTSDPKYYARPINKKSDFFKLSVELALDSAMQAQAEAYRLGSRWANELEKAAAADCLDLYNYTIKQLNRTSLDTHASRVDTQTWLSSALTNLETCRAGFIDFGVTDNIILPLMNNNVSSLISNTLAMNKVPYGIWGKYHKKGFPNWVSPGNRKLLQSTSPAAVANIVVAKDGSGNYKTVAAAVAAAAGMRSGNGRFVIYVKAGTYKENVEIRLFNISLVGDGIGKTIITGSKSVRGGSTTFASATIGEFKITNIMLSAQKKKYIFQIY